ncbi:threonine--tRNA ligase [Candidatus Micrarchaeota archaeon]|nr:threonine--tRNA ligase [Candidatus Micrarchaeota archaeon]
MRLLELHCDYVKVKPKQKALKGISELSEQEKNGTSMENVLVVFSTFEGGDDEDILDRACAEVEKNFREVKASAVLVYPYAHLSPKLAKPSIAQALLDKFLDKVKTFAPDSKKTPFGYYKEFELKCKGHPLAELSKTISAETAETKIRELGAKDTELFPKQSIFLDYAKATKKALTQTNSLEAQRNTATLLVVMAAEELMGAKPVTAFAKEDEAYVDFESKPINEETMKAIEKQANVIREKALPIKVKKTTELRAANDFQKEAAEESGEKEFAVAEVNGKEYWLPGPFTKNTKEVKAFLLTKFGGAYWKNNAKNAPLQRIHLIAANSPGEIEKYVNLQEEAAKRDHRAIGKQLELFSFHDEGTGFPFYHPNGVIVRNELMAYLREEFQSRGYKEIHTPIILNEDLWHRSGHWDHYRENMYFTSIDSALHAVKPMNCPGGMLVYKNKPHSYRELPLRLAEFGLVHRHELSGVLSGLFRVRAFTQDDAHVYCTHEQIHYEILKMLEFMDDVYSTFGFEYKIELSTKPEKAMGSPELWAKAEEALKRALNENKKPFEIHEGEGAFYGPKIDFKIKDALGREWQCGTIQLDFQMPVNFDLTYEGSDGKKHRPAMLHRTIYGSLERFMGVLIEHFTGAFPTWLSPVQVILLPLTDDDVKYADEVFTELQAKGIRVELDSSTGKIQGKIRDSQLRKIPYMLVVGKKEAEARTLSVRKRDGTVNHGVKLDAFASSLLEEIVERKL